MGGYIVKGKFIYNEDMVNLILQNINYGSVWKNIRSVSKNIYLLSRKYQESKLIELANPILSLIYIYSNNRWNLHYLSQFNIISIDFIRLTYNKLPWTRSLISMSTGITINDIRNADPDSIDWYEISMNPSIKVSDMLKYDYLPWVYRAASENISIRIEDIRNNLDKDWDYSLLARNSSLSIEDLSTIMDLSISTYWLQNENTTYDDVLKYIGLYPNDIEIDEIIQYIPLDENILQLYIDRDPVVEAFEIHKQSITSNIIKNNPQIDWDYVDIDYSKFTVEEVVNLPIINKFTFNYIRRILDHPYFTMDDFFEYFDINTFNGWPLLSSSSWLTFDTVLKYKDKLPWNHKGLSQNPNVTVDILEDSDFSWIGWDYYYYYLSRYAQLNWVYIIQHINKNWDFNRLSFNKSLNRKY